MRLVTVVLGGLLVAGAAGSAVHAAEVRLAVRNGKKVIFNVGRGSGAAGGSDLNWLARRHDRRTKYDTHIEHYAAKYGVDATFVRAVIQVESDFNPKCVSTKGARGLMQLMPATAKRFGVVNSFDPSENIHGGTRYLRWLLNKFDGNADFAVAAYNAGEGNVGKYNGVPPFRETVNYINRISKHIRTAIEKEVIPRDTENLPTAVVTAGGAR